MKIAIIGSGISGLVCARLLSGVHDVTVFEAADRLGGHTHTLDVPTATGGTVAVDTGFIVFNHSTYPNFTTLLERLGVASHETDMSFSVRDDSARLEYAGTGLNGMFAQRCNLVKPAFLRLVHEIGRFNHGALDFLSSGDLTTTLGDYLARRGFSAYFQANFIVPMGAAIWSATTRAVLAMPAWFFLRFFHNHQFLNLFDKPTWRVVTGGSRSYLAPLSAPFATRIRLATPVRAIYASPVGQVVDAGGGERQVFDHVILAAHSDQALGLLSDASPVERELLGALPYQPNEAVLHTDRSIMPRRRRAWASWNYLALKDADRPVAVTYHMNALQSLEQPLDYLVTLNGTEYVDPATILRTMTYHHPVFSVVGHAAQERFGEISGVRGRHFCGAYWGYGFHEDGVNSALRVCAYFNRSLDDV